jgi:hypothetical protein
VNQKVADAAHCGDINERVISGLVTLKGGRPPGTLPRAEPIARLGPLTLWLYPISPWIVCL